MILVTSSRHEMSACRARSSCHALTCMNGRPAVCYSVVSFSKLHGSDTHDLLRTSSGGCYEENVPVKFQLGLWQVRLERSQVRLPAVLLPGHYYMTLGKSSWEDASSALGQNGTAGMGVRTWRSVGVGWTCVCGSKSRGPRKDRPGPNKKL